MSIFDWFKKTFGSSEPAASVAEVNEQRGTSDSSTEDALAADGPAPTKAVQQTEQSAEQPAERQDGQPRLPDRLPGHLRKFVRDERLLPDTRPKPRSWFEKLPPRIPKNEADRLFSRGFRVRDRDLKRLVADETQLQRLGLPIWTGEQDVADALELSTSRLRWFANDRLDDGVFHYVQFRIPKSSGGSRVIMAPKSELRRIHRRLLDALVDRLPVSDYAHGFRKGRSIRTNAQPHVGRQFVVGMDLEDFFGTVTFGRVRGLLIAYGYGFAVATALALLMTEAERQPVDIDGGVAYTPISARYTVQGAPTSPGICNAVAMKLDHRLAGLARKYDCAYTRYADDIAFSGDDEDAIGPLLTVTREIVGDEGFRINEAKTRVMCRGSRQQVAGVVVNDKLGLSRQERRKVRAWIHRLNAEIDAGTADPEEVEQLEGKLAYIAMLNPPQAEALRSAWRG